MKSLLLLFILTSCSTVYYNFWETFGKEKRDLLKSNMTQAQEDQNQVKQSFKDTLEKIRSEYNFTSGKLEETYDKVSDDYEDAKEKSNSLSNRIDKVQDIAQDLFDEWKKEASELQNKEYKTQSMGKLLLTQQKFASALKSMRQVESKLGAILIKFKDRVLFLKHNLNAKTIGNFKIEFKRVSTEMTKLMRDIENSNKKADQFIKQIK